MVAARAGFETGRNSFLELIDAERELVGGFEKRRPITGLFWAVRFSPTQPGTWRWRWVATTPVVV